MRFTLLQRTFPVHTSYVVTVNKQIQRTTVVHTTHNGVIQNVCEHTYYSYVVLHDFIQHKCAIVLYLYFILCVCFTSNRLLYTGKDNIVEHLAGHCT